MPGNTDLQQALLLIDDAKLRRERFAGAARVLRRLDRLESAIESFSATDRELYQRWYDLAFREERRELERRQEELRALADFRRLVEVAGHLHRIPLWEAYRFVKIEEEKYRAGGPEERAGIEAARAARSRRLREELERQEREELEAAHARRKAASGPSRGEGGPDPLDELRSLDDEAIRQRAGDPGLALSMLGMVYGLADAPADYRLFFRLWDLVAPEIRAAFAEDFEEEMGFSWAEAMAEMRREFGAEERAPPTGGKREASPQEEQRLKSVYRRLARRLHPDARGGAAAPALWEKAAWLDAQAAYRARDLKALDRLYKITLIRRGELRDLTLAEIAASADWLEEEFRSLERRARPMKRLPWWRFSKRKSHDPLIRKLRRGLADELWRLEAAAEELREENEYLEMRSARRPRPRRRRKG